MTHWKSELFCTAFNRQQLPSPELDEIVFAGRSNVGKSTLINSLLNRTIAKVSSKPGKTRSINFYKIETAENEKFMLVDIPGYGYAARDSKERQSWWRLIEDYFRMKRKVSYVVHLVDFRHGMLANDLELEAWLDQLDMPRQIVFTKGDKIPSGKRKVLYKKYVSEDIESLLPPFITMGKNDESMEALRLGLIQARNGIAKLKS